jgi:hypothetical protein
MARLPADHQGLFMTAPRALRRTLTVLALTIAATGIAAAPATADCSTPSFSTPFSAFRDSGLYTLAPGGTFDDPAAGWTLGAGARIVATIQPDGTTNGVLDLPSKATAVSPVMCITSDYPTARLWVRNIVGAEGVFFYVSYNVNGTWTTPKNTGQFHGDHLAWTLSNPMNVQPSTAPGWQLARFTFVAGGNTSRFQVNDFWVDPRMRA